MKKELFGLLLIVSLTTISSQASDKLPEEKLKLSDVAIMLEKDCRFTLNAFNEVNREKLEVRWESKNSSVAVIDKKGQIKAIADGETEVVATAQNGEKASCKVTVGMRGQNPTLPPFWKLYIADPEAAVFDDGVYVYGSMDVENGLLPSGRSWCSDRYHVLYSKDLVHWADKGVSFHLDSIPAKLKSDKIKRLWAPDVLKHPVTGKYYLYSCYNQTGSHVMTVSVSDYPEGPFHDTKMLQVDNGDSIVAIDPAVLVDDDGRAYVTWPFKMGQLDPDDYSKVLNNTIVDMKQWMPLDNDPFEGPSLFKRGDLYYYVYIQNNGLRILPNGTRNISPTRMAYMTSKHPLGPYTYKGLIIANTNYPSAINIHGSVVEFKGNWYVFYHMPVIDMRLTRVMCIDRVEFDNEGNIKTVLPSSSGIKGQFLPGDRICAGSAVDYPGGYMNPAYESKNGMPQLTFSKAGSFAGYRYVSFKNNNPETASIRVRSNASGGVFEIRLNGIDGPLLARIEVPDTLSEWRIISEDLQNIKTEQSTFYIVMTKVPVWGTVELQSIVFK